MTGHTPWREIKHKAPRFNVSYRLRWWDPRRWYACGNVSEEDAKRTTHFLRSHRGYCGVRVSRVR